MTHTVEVGTGGSGFRASIRERVPAHDALARFFREHDRVPPRSKFAKFVGRDVLTDVSRPLFHHVVGQLSVASALAELDDDWAIFNAVPVASRESDIDHLIIGPGGVFALTVANHSDHGMWIAHGAFRAAGSHHNHIRNAEFEVGCVERLLGAAVGSTVTAVGVIAVIDPRSVVVREEPRDVAVMTSADLVSWLQRQPMSLSADAVTTLAAAASSPLTWLQDSCVDTGSLMHERFSDVQRESRRAASVRRLWMLSTIAIVTVGFSLWAWALVMLEAT